MSYLLFNLVVVLWSYRTADLIVMFLSCPGDLSRPGDRHLYEVKVSRPSLRESGWYGSTSSARVS